MAIGIRLADGRDFDQVFARRVSGILYPAVGIRASDGRDLVDIYENLRVSRGPVTNFRRSDGGDMYNYLDTQTGSFLAFNETSYSGSVPAGPGDYGVAVAKAQTDGYMRYSGTWQGARWTPWFSNPQAGIGNSMYVYFETTALASPAFSQWGGNINQWLPISSQPSVSLAAKPSGTGAWSGVVNVYFGFSSGQIAQTAHITMTCRGRFKDL